LLTLVLRNLSAVIAGRQGEPLREVAIQRDVLLLRRERFGEEHPQTLAAMNNLAHALSGAGQREEAERYAREALQGRERVLGEFHPSTVVSRNNLSALYIQRGAIDDAEPLVRSVVAWNAEHLGPLHPNTLTSRNILAYLLEEQGSLAEAESLYREIHAAVDRGGDDGLRSQMLAVGNNLAMLLLARGDAAAAVGEFERLMREAERLLGDGHPNFAVFQANHGWALHQLGRSEEAVQLLEASLRQLRPALGEAHPRVAMTEERLSLARGR
jgi:tetratricopeptide (TPR) repeat protein